MPSLYGISILSTNLIPESQDVPPSQQAKHLLNGYSGQVIETLATNAISTKAIPSSTFYPHSSARLVRHR